MNSQRRTPSLVLLALVAITINVFVAPIVALAQGYPGPYQYNNPRMWAYTEGNDQDIDLSSGQPIPGGGQMIPDIWTTIGVRCIVTDPNTGWDGAATYERVDFEASPSGYLTFGQDYDYTNAFGRARIVVKANSSATIPANTVVTITARWKRKDNSAQTLLSRFVRVVLKTLPAGSPINWPWASNNVHQSRPEVTYWKMPWYDKSIYGDMDAPISNRISNGLTMWTLFNPNTQQNAIFFTTLSSPNYNPDIVFEWMYNPRETNPADTNQVYRPNGSSYQHIQFNAYHLDGDYYARKDGDAMRDRHDCMPLEWRHWTQSTISHEIGHALGAGHLPENFYTSIMSSRASRYFLGLTIYPSSQDGSLMMSHYVP